MLNFVANIDILVENSNPVTHFSENLNKQNARYIKTNIF